MDTEGEPIDDPETIARIVALAIPPAWREVWICMDPYGHLQATGIDAAGRKQYLYHQRWRAHRDRRKFDTMLDFGHALPRIRRSVAHGLAGEGLGQERVMACAVRMLDVGFFRIGSEDYAERNDSYGLATMLKEHVCLEDGVLVFDYPAKSGQRRVQAIVDPDVVEVVTALRRRRGGGEGLLAYRSGRRWVDVRSEDVNAYLKQIGGSEFSAKDFRTWNATVLAAVMLAAKQSHANRRRASGAGRAPGRDRATPASPSGGSVSKERAIRETVKAVAAFLGNTPAVCRASYIDPRVFDRFRAGATIAAALPNGNGPDLASPRVRSRVERAVLGLLA